MGFSDQEITYYKKMGSNEIMTIIKLGGGGGGFLGVLSLLKF